MHGTLERHATWDVDDRFVLPALDGLLGKRVRCDSVDETVVYYDTLEHDLHAFGVTLRRHDGDGEAGWQLEIPVGDGHTELRWPPLDHPPAEASGLLTGLTGGKGLVDIAKIHTLRERYRSSKPRLEVGDDRVRASIGERLLAWREIEVDTGGRARTTAKRIGKRLRAAGARRSPYSSKLVHVAPAEPIPGSRAATAFADYLNAQIDQIAAGDIGLRRGRDPIHDTRCAAQDGDSGGNDSRGERFHLRHALRARAADSRLFPSRSPATRIGAPGWPVEGAGHPGLRRSAHGR